MSRSLNLSKREELAVRSTGRPEMVRYLDEESLAVGDRAEAFRKIAAAARAELDATLAVRALMMLRDDVANPIEYRRHIEVLEGEIAGLVRANEALTLRTRQLSAAPAMAVHSGD